MKRKERMGLCIERIAKILQQLPATRANEIEVHALWAKLSLSHADLVKDGYDYARSTKQMNKWLELAEKFKEEK